MVEITTRKMRTKRLSRAVPVYTGKVEIGYLGVALYSGKLLVRLTNDEKEASIKFSEQETERLRKFFATMAKNPVDMDNDDG